MTPTTPEAAMAAAFMALTRDRFKAAGLPYGPLEWDDLSDEHRSTAIADAAVLAIIEGRG